MKTPVTIRPAHLEDVPGIVHAASACPGAPLWTAEQYAEAVASSLQGPQRRTTFVAVLAGEVIGFAVATLVAAEAELESVAVLPEHRRHGVGHELCSAVLRWAREHDAARMLLEVRASNVGAQSLYRLLGFSAAGTRRGYYTHPLEDAVLMSANLQQANHL